MFIVNTVLFVIPFAKTSYPPEIKWSLSYHLEIDELSPVC